MKNENKIKARTFYETHLTSVKDLAQQFNISEKTLYYWIKKENWQQASINIDVENNELVQDAILSKIDAAKQNIKKELVAKFDEKKCLFDESVIDTTSDEILLKAMSVKMLDKTMIEMLYISKQAAISLAKHSHTLKEKKELISATTQVVSCAESVKKSIHGKEVPNIAIQLNTNNILSAETLTSLSDDELRKMIDNENKD